MAGAKVVGGTGVGYKGTQSFQSLGLVPALQLAPHPDDEGVCGAQVLPGSVHDQAHALRHGHVLLANAADATDRTDVANLVALRAPRFGAGELVNDGEIVDVHRDRINFQKCVANERRGRDDAVEPRAGESFVGREQRRQDPPRHRAQIRFALQLARHILVRVEDDRLAPAFELEPGGNQFGIMEMVDVRVQCEGPVEHPLGGLENPLQPAGQAADVGDRDPFGLERVINLDALP